MEEKGELEIETWIGGQWRRRVRGENQSGEGGRRTREEKKIRRQQKNRDGHLLEARGAYTVQRHSRPLAM